MVADYIELHLWSYMFHIYTCKSYIPAYVFPCSGVGRALCERLLSHDPEGLQLCLACRDMQRAQNARAALLSSHPTAQVTLVQMDTSSVSSVIAAAQEVKRRWDAEESGCYTYYFEIKQPDVFHSETFKYLNKDVPLPS